MQSTQLEIIKKIRLFGSSISILFVEDEETIRQEVQKMLLKLFNRVDIAVNGAEALEMFNNNDYDLVITDLQMPVMNGIELIKEISQRNKEQTVILLSAHKDLEDILTLINIGIVGFLTKPIDMDMMLERLYIVVKNIYANKMMKYHYEEMKKDLHENASISEEELHYRDSITSLHNQKYFLQNVNNNETKWAILININDFRLINDYYSYAHGNHLLYQIAEVLKFKGKKYGYDIFKLSNDEFVLLRKEPPKDCEDLQKDALAIFRGLDQKRYSIIGVNNIAINITMGIAKGEEHILEHLHCALAYAKKHGLRYALYKDIPDERDSIKNIIEVTALLKDSIENSLVIPTYQPIPMKDKALKYEVLMRIKRVNGGALIAPAYFLDIAKSHSFYNDISQMVIFKALEKMFNGSETISINFSYADIKNGGLLEKLEEIIKKHNIGSRLVFEIVETEHLDNIKITLAFIERFKGYGVKIAIDDFGSGYSNFANIFLLNPDIIKIDGSLVQKMLEDSNMTLFIETIIEFAHKLNIQVVAEFVSSKEIYDALEALNIDGYQGYYIGHPKEVI